MSQHHNNEFDDNNLSELYKQGASEQPSDRISHGILNAAKKQAKLNQSGWNLVEYLLSIISSSRSLAFAAVMVIGISIILQIQFDQPEQIVPQGISDLSNGSPVSKMKSPSDDSLTKPEAITESMESIADSKIAPPQPSVIKQKARSAQPVTPAKKTTSESNRKKSEEARQTMLEKEHLKQRRSQERKERQQKQMMRTPESAFAPAPAISPLLEMTPYQSTMPVCKTLTNKACLTSAICILARQDNQLICRSPDNHCENGFVQFDRQEEQCIQKDNCKFIKSECECDTSETCSCSNNTPPSCKLSETAE